MQKRTQRQHPDQNTTRSLTPHRALSQNATKRRETQPQEPEEGISILLDALRILRQVSRTMQVIIGVIAVITVLGVFTLFILAATIPNAYIGIAALLSSTASFVAGVTTGKMMR